MSRVNTVKRSVLVFVKNVKDHLNFAFFVRNVKDPRWHRLYETLDGHACGVMAIVYLIVSIGAFTLAAMLWSIKHFIIGAVTFLMFLRSRYLSKMASERNENSKG